MAFDEGRKILERLVSTFDENHSDFLDDTYNETQLRIDFLNPLLIAFGWDVDNTKRKAQYLRDVIQEYGFVSAIQQTSKKPDYTIRYQGKRKFFIEAKKPSIQIESDPDSAFQTRRYGWSAKLPISILCNFEYLIIYDCIAQPKITDNERNSRIHIFHYLEYQTKFEEIYDLISCETVYSGKFNEMFEVDPTFKANEYFDNYFLEQIECWRKRLAINLNNENDLNEDELNYLVQKIISRLLFLRICEDREIEKYELLKEITDYEDLKRLFIESDEKYNSGLFDLIEDELTKKINIDDDVLISIFNELYYPQCPYTFSVMDPHILGEIYEVFLGKYIHIEDENIEIIEKPEIKESQGVVPTPKFIVDEIIDKTLSGYHNLSYSDLITKKLIDISCGSGIFLLSIFERICNYALETILLEGVENHRNKVYEINDNVWNLTLNAKKDILENTIFGVDIDDQATEVTRFGLLIKLLENETKETIDGYMKRSKCQALPNLNANI